jgi:hypothetical protein
MQQSITKKLQVENFQKLSKQDNRVTSSGKRDKRDLLSGWE